MLNMEDPADIQAAQRTGRRLGIDVGGARIGVAVSDSAAMLATPVETVYRDSPLDGPDGSDIADLADIALEYQVVEVIIGLPRTLRGERGKAVLEAENIGRRLAAELKAQGSDAYIRYVDERLTTVIATQALRQSGVSAKAGRKVIDQAAAVAILQTWLDARTRALASQSSSNT